MHKTNGKTKQSKTTKKKKELRKPEPGRWIEKLQRRNHWIENAK